MSLRRAVAILSFIGTDDFGREVFVDELGTIWKYTEPGPMPRERHDKLYTASSNGRDGEPDLRCPMRSTTRLSTRRRNTMSAVYRTLYEKYEQNDVYTSGFRRLSRPKRRLTRSSSLSTATSATSSTRCWGVCPAPTRCRVFFSVVLHPAQSGTERRLPNRATDTAGAFGPITAQRLLRSARLTARQIRSYMSIRVSLLPPVLPVWMTVLLERCARESCPTLAVSSSGTSSSKSFTGTQKYFKILPFCSCFPRACVV